jgi:hypothetical protein
MKNAMPVLTEIEIDDGYQIHHNGHIYEAYELPKDDGHAYGHDENGRDYDLHFVWTTLGYWVFVSANLAEHETEI